jgi:hypothetical protein
MKYQYFISSRWRNRDQVLSLASSLRKKGKSVYCFIEEKHNPGTIHDDPEQVMTKFEARKNWRKDPFVKRIFKRDLTGIEASRCVIVLLPGGKSTHIEAGIAYGFGKKLILIGEQKETESLYFIFNEVYNTSDEFLKSVK